MELKNEISAGYSKIFQNRTMNQTVYEYTVEKIIKRRFKDKSITTPEEMFAFMEQLVPKRENAFLFCKFKRF